MANKEIYSELKKRIVYLDYKPKQLLKILVRRCSSDYSRDELLSLLKLFW